MTNILLCAINVGKQVLFKISLVLGGKILKKKAVVLYGSPHENGHTSQALNSVIKKLNYNFNFEFVNAFKENIKPCIDCGFCKKNPKCIFDDFYKIDKCLRESELIIVATPIYNFSVPAPLKAIIDRTQVYFNMKTKLKINPFYKQKKAILIVTYGAGDTSCEKIILKQLHLFFILINAKLCKTIFTKNTDNINLTE